MTAPARQSLIAWRVFWNTHPRLARAKSFALRIIWDFISAIGRSWWRVGIASGAGILLVLNKEAFVSPTLRSLAEHVGIGLIVAGIAVFGYEFRSAARDLLERIDRLQGMIDARAQEGLQACLSELLPDDHHVDNPAIRATIYTVVQKLHETPESESMEC
jgi:hypothetical protein